MLIRDKLPSHKSSKVFNRDLEEPKILKQTLKSGIKL
jgi:hypothetical protein